MGIRNLAEAIILQSIEDLSIEGQREDCIRFFNGHGFNICAGIAGINSADQEKLFSLVDGQVRYENRKIRNSRRGNNAEYTAGRGR